MTFPWLVVPNSIGLFLSMLQLCLLAAYPSLSLQKNGYENDDMMGRRIRESYVVLIDTGVMVEEVDSSLRWIVDLNVAQISPPVDFCLTEDSYHIFDE